MVFDNAAPHDNWEIVSINPQESFVVFQLRYFTRTTIIWWELLGSLHSWWQQPACIYMDWNDYTMHILFAIWFYIAYCYKWFIPGVIWTHWNIQGTQYWSWRPTSMCSTMWIMDFSFFLNHGKIMEQPWWQWSQVCSAGKYTGATTSLYVTWTS